MVKGLDERNTSVYAKITQSNGGRDESITPCSARDVF